MDQPLNVTVEIVPKRRFLIKGYSWNVYDENDRVNWDGSRGAHGWMLTLKLAFWAAKFIVKLRYL